MSGSGKVHALFAGQMDAVAPDETVWLSASAGTGKTQVLSSRVLRLLLQPAVQPSQILCLTFTKAGATEMAARINETLAQWVRLPDSELFERLEAIGASADPETRDRARTLFAAVLDCPGGGLRIDTIHAFSQWLLAAFPYEAGLIPGSRPMEDRERAMLARRVLSDLLVAAESEPLGDPQILEAVEHLSLRMGPDAVEGYLLRCAQAREAWFGPGGWQEPMRPNVLRLLGLPSDLDESGLADLCEKDAFDEASLRACMEINGQWTARTGQETAARIGEWIAGKGAARLESLDALASLFLTAKGEPRSARSQEKIDPAYGDHASRVIACIDKVREQRALLDLVALLVPALRLGRAFALAWEDAKQREGLIDFDDQIRQAANLLADSGMADWIRYKLDRRFDHVLVDEAQDTNAAQWDIIDALVNEFFVGEGQRADAVRTLFVVGDYKQAIFRFQGTSPENFRNARDKVRVQMERTARNLEDMRGSARPRTLRQYGLDRSFRTAQPVLDVVDRAIAAIGHEAFGLQEEPGRHVGWQGAGTFALWRPIGAASGDDEEEVGGQEDPGEGHDWFSRPDRMLAEKIAMQVRDWLDPDGPGFLLQKEGGRRAGPSDIMILVRKRRELAGLIVARLHAAGVPVAGVDRLRLGAPLAVQDLMAALRFAGQPLDDLNLASLLVSPLVGWSQETLLRLGYRERGQRLWNHLRASTDEEARAALDHLGQLLALADFEPPQALLHWMLVGPWNGRKALVGRLGMEANDPIDELLNAAHAFATSETASLAGFIAWFDAGDGELKREADSARDLVRVMTVHGSKGLQSPIVILADATGNPDDSKPRGLDLPDPANPARRIPIPSLRKNERVGRLADAHAAEAKGDAEEHWRLLYVAMTRAEEALFAGGALGARESEPSENSWFARLSGLFEPDSWLDDPLWGARLQIGGPPDAIDTARAEAPIGPSPAPRPEWLDSPPKEEPRPPRPLAPSSLGEDETPDPPFPPGGGGDAARRGTLIHALLERMPAADPEERPALGKAWLERKAADLPEPERAAMLADALRVLDHPDWSDLFAPHSLAEVPIAARIGGVVVAGTVDRLLVTADRVRIVDFKTSRRPPESLDDVPRAILRQMAAYAAAVETLYPGRTVDAALLYTASPRLIAIPQSVLDDAKRGLALME